MTAAIDPLAVAVVVARHLETLGVPYTTGASIASSFAGEPRSTLDIDLVVALEEAQVDALAAALAPDFYVDVESLRRAVRTRTSASVIHQPTQVEVDLFIAGGTPLDRQQLSRRLAVDLGEGRRLYVHPPEDILLQKLRWFRRGGHASQRQWRDIVGIVRVQGPRFHLDYLRAHAPSIGAAGLLERALAEG